MILIFLLTNIPEYDEMSILLEMMTEDELTNNHSVISFLEQKWDALTTILNASQDAFSELINMESVENKNK